MKRQKKRELLAPSTLVWGLIWLSKKEGILKILPVLTYSGVLSLGRAIK